MRDPEKFVTFVLGAYVFIFYFVVLYQTARVWKRIGRCPLVVFTHGGFKEGLWGTALLSNPLLVLVWAYCPAWFSRVPQLHSLENWPTRMMGLLCLCLAAALYWTACIELGDSWRIGVDPQSSAPVKIGIYSSMRHPILTAAWLWYFGIFLLAPHLLFALFWAAASVVILWMKCCVP